MKKYSLLLLLLIFLTSLSAQKKVVKKTAAKPAAIASIQSPLKLWYDNPATYFEESLVLGNGMQGATVFGGIGTDKIYLNDLTLWSGEP
ncbi:MAG: glycoside hydrolase N-terminal domain-containing protein, partial [Sediminibacterium sp.]